MVRYVVPLIVWSVFILAEYAGAQDIAAVRPQPLRPDSSRSFNNISFLFDDSYDTYHWTGNGAYQNLFGSLFCSVNENFQSSVIKADRTYITDQQQFDLVLRRRFSSLLSGAVKASSFILSDDRSINLGKTSTQSLYGGIEYRPMFQFVLEPLIGVSFDKQTAQTDKGISYLLNTALDTIDYNGYKTALAGKWKYDQLIPRRLETRNLEVSIDRNFFEDTRNSLEAFYSYLRRDIYIPAEQAIIEQYNTAYNIETRTESLLGFLDTLGYSINQKMSLTLSGTIAGREIGRATLLEDFSDPAQLTPPTTVDELRLEGSSRFTYRPSDGMHATVRFDYLERDERHTIDNPGVPPSLYSTLEQSEERKNNHSRRTGLAGDITAALSSNDTIAFSGSGNLLRYDTPSLENDDDRDELWYFFSVNATHRFNRYLTGRVMGDVNLMHLVYIASTRSANNTWNRIVRFAPAFDYTPSTDFLTSNTFEVLANYTAYDYEFGAGQVESFAYRQFVFHDSTVYKLTPHVSLSWLHHLKFYEQGEFRWSDFSERPVNYFADKLYIASIRYSLYSGLLFSVGFRYFSQTRYAYQGSEKYVDHFLRSIGPSTEIAWASGKHTVFSLKGWYENQHQTGETNRGFTNVTMNLLVHI